MADPADLLLSLESSRRLHRDRGLGRIYHLGGVSFRESQPTDSLHISVHGNRLAAHVDRLSPLGVREERAPRYSLRRAAVHNLGGVGHDLARLLRGRQGDHRCQLNCEWVWDVSSSEPHEDDLLDASATSWSVQLDVRVAGVLDEQRLRAALTAVLGAEPTEDPLEVVDCPDEPSLNAARDRLQTEVVWPGQSPPLRAYLARHPNGDVLMLNLNHAATDGFGALRILNCIADAYAHGTAPVPPLDFLATRTVPVRPASAPVSRAMRAYRALVEKLRDGLARPSRLAPDGASEETGYGFHLIRLSREETTRVVSAERPGTSRNTLLAALHLTIGQWNVEHDEPGRQVGVLVPANLRPPEWPEAKIGNFSVTTRVSTRRKQRSTPAAALEAVTAQTTRNKRTRTGVALIAALERTDLLALWAKQSLVVLQPLTGNRRVDTAMLAQLGWLEDEPSFGPEAGETLEVWYSVPARAPMALCVGAVTVAGCLHLTFRYPRRVFGPDGARRFAECYVDNVHGVADARSQRDEVSASSLR